MIITDFLPLSDHLFPSVNYAALLLIFDLAKYAEKLVNRTLTQNPLKKNFRA